MSRPDVRTLRIVAMAFLSTLTPSWAATFIVSNVGDSGGGSLRQAIESANSLPGPDVIQFNIPGAGPHIITPGLDLPGASEVTVDGTTQPGYSGKPRIVIRGGSGTSSYGLLLFDDCAVRGLAVNNFSSVGLLVFGSRNVISGC